MRQGPYKARPRSTPWRKPEEKGHCITLYIYLGIERGDSNNIGGWSPDEREMLWRGRQWRKILSFHRPHFGVHSGRQRGRFLGFTSLNSPIFLHVLTLKFKRLQLIR